MRRQWEKQDKTGQLAAISVEGLNRKHPMASVGKSGKESSGAPLGRQMEKKTNKQQPHHQQVNSIKFNLVYLYSANKCHLKALQLDSNSL